MCLPIDGSSIEFPECPAAYLRTAQEVTILRLRTGKPVFAKHLIDGHVHPSTLASEAAFELEAGARNGDSLSPKLLEAAHLWLREKNAARDYEAEKRRKQSK
jgi:hypothetical protein